ncbi:MAG: amidohydrolase family protein [Dehalococcoidia bacterium]
MKAIDVHFHPQTKEGWDAMFSQRELEFAKKFRGGELPFQTEEEMVQTLKEADAKALLIAWDVETTQGRVLSNKYIGDLVKKYPDVFVGGWACVDPWKGKIAVDEVERSVREYGLMGLKTQAVAQGFFPNDKRFYPLYEKCAELKIPVLFHAGFTGLASGMPGGGGYHLKYTRPIYIDDVAADFPELTIVAAHPAWPWQDEMIAIALHKGNVFIDISGWLPKYFPDALKREINGRLQDKIMFGTDNIVSPKVWLEAFEAENYKPGVVEKVFYKNAQRILKL